jgi:hypothetical protein
MLFAENNENNDASSTIISNILNESPDITWIDVHTGLGPFGKDSLQYVLSKRSINNDDDDNDNDDIDYNDDPSAVKDKYFPTSYSVTSSMSSSSSTTTTRTTSEAFQGYDLTMGMLTSYLATRFTSQKNKPGIYIVQEFGTLPSILVGYSLIVDNMIYQYHKRYQKMKETSSQPLEVDGIISTYNIYDGDDNERFSYRSPWLKQAFYPQSSQWRSSIIQRGVSLMLQSIEICKERGHKQRNKASK